MGTPIDLDKFRSIGVIGKRTKPVVREGRQHPETGKSWKSTSEPDSGLTTTEHNTKDDRVDATVRPTTVRVVNDGGALKNA